MGLDTLLLQKYRRDRHELLLFLLSANVMKKVVMPPGAYSIEDVDMETVSVDYVLECAKRSTTLDLAEAIKRHYQDPPLPPAVGSGLSEAFFLVTPPEASGAPPTRAPPPIARSLPSVLADAQSPSPMMAKRSIAPSVVSKDSRSDTLFTANEYEDEDDLGYEDDLEGLENRRRAMNDASDLVNGLPSFSTGLSDDDLRETAYEILLACLSISGSLVAPPPAEAARDKRIFRKRFSRTKKDKASTPVARLSGMAGIQEIMRAQMQIEEATDRATRAALLKVGSAGAATRGAGRPLVDRFVVPVELLALVERAAFRDRTAFSRWQKRLLTLLETGLILHPAVPLDQYGRQAQELRSLIAKIQETEGSLGADAPSQREEALRALRAVASGLAERVGRGDPAGEPVCHWADGYHLNVSLYEKLLQSVFDVLDEGQLVEESGELLKSFELTWEALGITQTVHDTCYAWVLFRQFVMTGEDALLSAAVGQLQRIPGDRSRTPGERALMRLMRTVGDGLGAGDGVTYVQSVLTPVKFWADKRLLDYHQEFPEGGEGRMELLLTCSVVCGRLLAEESDQAGSMGEQAEASVARKQVEDYVKASLRLAFNRMLEDCAMKQGSGTQHALALLGRDALSLARTEATCFGPTLSRFHPAATGVGAALLHSLYGMELKPFLGTLRTSQHLTDEAAAVLRAADALEVYLQELVGRCPEGQAKELRQKMPSYEVDVASSDLLMRWVRGQLDRLSEWVERTLVAETWEPISSQVHYGHSGVEVLRILEEVLDQFFGMHIPMKVAVVHRVMSGIDGALQLYANRVLSGCGSTEDLYPATPPLTRFKKEASVKLTVTLSSKRRDARLIDDKRAAEISALTVGKLCTRLNTLNYILLQVDSVEERVRDQWAARSGVAGGLGGGAAAGGAAGPGPGSLGGEGGAANGRRASCEDKRNRRTSSLIRGGDEVGPPLEGSRKALSAGVDRLCEFLGVKVVLWDMREVFLEGLYRPSVAQGRITRVVAELDPVLSQICEVIAGQLRDRLVMSLLQAALDGLLRVLLDGGPARVFAETDSDMLDADLAALQDFFVAEGDGLPRGVVESTSGPVAQILNLFSLPTDVVVEQFRLASEKVAAQSLPTMSPRGSPRTATDADTLLRILCHRADRNASKFLKKSFKLPKSFA